MYSELDLPSHSLLVQCTADLLDHLRPTKDIWKRLNFLNKALETHGHIEAAED